MVESLSWGYDECEYEPFYTFPEEILERKKEKTGIRNISASWEGVTSTCRNSDWQKVGPEACNCFVGFKVVELAIASDTIQLVNQVGVDEVNFNDAEELLMRKATDSQDEVNEINSIYDSDVEDDLASVGTSGNFPTLPQDPASNSRSDITQQNVLSVKQFHIRHAVDHMVATWNKITLTTIKHAWKPLFPHLSNARVGCAASGRFIRSCSIKCKECPSTWFPWWMQNNEMFKENDEEMLDDVADESPGEAGESVLKRNGA
ncbi:hypothetical protein Hamer_G008220 [Homarus americanus]|uniref:Uncharacterized protein n=1 Tax=Homarus americanus TaxID=6706 RepID=A0A8J5NEL1_HOMAM|nr:hypothetical protein Hamer_G008220 [Homarus americanus]